VELGINGSRNRRPTAFANMESFTAARALDLRMQAIEAGANNFPSIPGRASARTRSSIL